MGWGSLASLFSVVVFKAAAPAHLEFHACDTQTPRLNTRDKRNKYEAGSKSEILHQVQSTKEARRCGTIPQEGRQGMNIFVLHRTPWKAAQMMCDKHIPKMIVESAQMMASALIRHGATPDMMPTTKAARHTREATITILARFGLVIQETISYGSQVTPTNC